MRGTGLPVRLAVPADAPALVAVAAETFPLACPPGTDPEAIAVHVATKLNAAAFSAWVEDDAATLVVAPAEGALRGYALVVTGPCADASAEPDLIAHGIDVTRLHELSKIYVLPAFHGGGTAGALLEAALESASSTHGALPAWLGTNRANARAQAFYARHGFAAIGGRTYVVGGQEHADVVMLRR